MSGTGGGFVTCVRTERFGRLQPPGAVLLQLNVPLLPRTHTVPPPPLALLEQRTAEPNLPAVEAQRDMCRGDGAKLGSGTSHREGGEGGYEVCEVCEVAEVYEVR